MIKEITINLKVDGNNNVCKMDIVEGTYGRTEYVMEHVDKPITVKEAIENITEYLEEVDTDE